MKPPFEEEYKGYLLKFMPQLTHDGRFLPFVIITHGVEPVNVDRAGSLEGPSFALESEAALAGLCFAIRWIDEEYSPEARSQFSPEVGVEIASGPRTRTQDGSLWVGELMGASDARH